MKGRRAILLLGVLLILSSYAVEWYSTGGTGTPLTTEDYRVKAARDYLASEAQHQTFAAEGTVESAWLCGDSRGYEVNVIVFFNQHPWRGTVVFSGDGAPLESSVRLSGGTAVYMMRLGTALVVLWLVVGQLLPRLFWAKCPDCPGNFWRPAFLQVSEGFVYPGGFDDRGDPLAPIVRKDDVCPQCDYRRVTYYIPGTRGPGAVFRSAVFARAVVTVNQEEFMQKMHDKWWETNPRKTKFHDQNEWRAYYDELKASEREERDGPAHG